MTASFVGEGLDDDGYIINFASLSKIPAYATHILQNVREQLVATFSNRMHSVYLYGSMASGTAKPPKSDVDLIVVFGQEPNAAEKNSLASISQILSAKYHDHVREVGLESHSLPKALDPNDLYGWGCFLKHLTVCFWGDDLAEQLPKFRPSVEISRAFNGDYSTELEKLKAKLADSSDAAAIETCIRRIARKTIRTSFSLVMPRAQCWITDLDRSCEVFLSFYPQHVQTMQQLQIWGAMPPRCSEQILLLIDDYSPWLIKEFQKQIP